MSRTLYRVTTSIAGVDEESEHYVETEAQARTAVLDWRGQIGEDTGDAWDVYAYAVVVDVPDAWPTPIVLALLKGTSDAVTVTGDCLMSNRCHACDGEIEDTDEPNAFAVDVAPLTTRCADCADNDGERECAQCSETFNIKGDGGENDGEAEDGTIGPICPSCGNFG